MEEKESRISKLFKEYLSKMNPIKEGEDASQFYGELTRGKTSYMKLNRLATSFFDMTWINAIEDCLFDLGDIIKNPREVTKTEPVLVPVELARKTSSESVRHLASHTQYIKTISEEGDVVPNKVITMANEEDFHTYENRFIATLVRRLVLFIEKRYEFIQSFPPFSDEQILYFKNDSIVNGAHVEIETKIKIQSESDTSLAEISNNYINRIKEIREYVLYYFSSQFMRTMKTDRDVRNPIIMTNILRKNPKYHKCYELYRFIERYQQLGVSYKVDENVSMLDDKEIEELNTVMFTNYLAAQDRERTKKLKSTSRSYKPKILTSIDDEQFVYGELLKGPIEFLRIDDAYQQYLDSKIKKNLPLHPTKAEKEYYEQEYKNRKIRKEDKEQLEKLKKRKTKEALENEKRIKKIIAEREAEEEARRQAEAEAARAAEEARLDEIRRQIIAAAQEEAEKEAETKRRLEEEAAKEALADEKEESEVPEETPVEQPEETPVEELPTEDKEQSNDDSSTAEDSENLKDQEADESKESPANSEKEPEVPEESPTDELPVEDKEQPSIEEVPEEKPVETPAKETPVEEVSIEPIEVSNKEPEEASVIIPKKKKSDGDPTRYVKVGGSKRKKKGSKEESNEEQPSSNETTPEEQPAETLVEETPTKEVSAESVSEEAPAEVVIPKKKKTASDDLRYVKIGGSKRKKKNAEEHPAEEVTTEEPGAEEPVVEEQVNEVPTEQPEEPAAVSTPKKKKKNNGDSTRYVKVGGSKRKNKKAEPVEGEPVSDAPNKKTKKEPKVVVIPKKKKTASDDLRYVKIGGSKRKNRNAKPKKKEKIAIISKHPKGNPSRYVKVGGSKRKKKAKN